MQEFFCKISVTNNDVCIYYYENVLFNNTALEKYIYQLNI